MLGCGVVLNDKRDRAEKCVGRHALCAVSVDACSEKRSMRTSSRSSALTPGTAEAPSRVALAMAARGEPVRSAQDQISGGSQ